ncbi:LysR substrate-binding domain-containing protein [Streptomyces sp. NPDC059398]|uniref:LysR family transcriptional regulator n=1 Tax=Streptomyces sp. NPDC059398 TaxID=3346820 RepID=UPI0036870666
MASAGTMTMAQLRAFLAAARTGSFTAAGAELNLAQASVSELIRRLEQEYRLVLFARGARRLTLTGAGRALLPAAERAVAGFDAADGTLRAYGGLTGGTASFGVLRNAEYYRLTHLARTFHERHPDVRVRLVGQNSVEVAAAVARGDLEAGIVVLPVDVTGLDVRPLLRDEVVMVTSDPSRYGAAVTAAGLAAAPLVLYDAHFGWDEPTRRQIRDWVTAEGHELRPVVEVESVTSALRLVSGGTGDTFVARAVTRSDDFPAGLRIVPFAEPFYDVVASVSRDARTLSPASLELLLLAEEMIRSVKDA